ncbi:MAG: biopolymer transporter ExbD [Myxococcales bacterium]|jgi:biopolymer transport protein TolR|nr:biopolymer transporter ExbD [Myxococcales bacterium]
MAMNTGGSDQLNAEINVTPLVDVMLVLLIIFMITAPMMNTGVDLDLPQITAQQIEDPQGKLVLSIDKTRRLRLGTSVVVWKDLQVKLSKNERVQQEKQLYIEADASLPYSVVVTAMAIAKDAGVAKVMMLTDPTQNLKLDELDAAAPPGGP